MGVSGAVFLLPVQVSVLGVPSPAVTPTNLGETATGPDTSRRHPPTAWKSRRSAVNPRSSRLGWTRFVSRIA